jgi:hypothetical protein
MSVSASQPWINEAKTAYPYHYTGKHISLHWLLINISPISETAMDFISPFAS